MLKIFTIFLINILIFIGCGDTTIGTQQKATNSSSQSQNYQTEYKISIPSSPPFIVFNGNIGEIDANLSK